MSFSSLLTGRLPVALVSSVVTAAIVGGATVLVSAQDSGDTTIHACVGKLTGIVRIPDAGKPCLKSETPLEWNQRGPEGPAGADGEDGAPGPQGPAGEDGAGLSSLDGLAGLDCQNGGFSGVTTLSWEAGVAVIRCEAPPPPPSDALLVTDVPDTVDLGTAPVNSEALTRTVTVTNAGLGSSNPLTAVLLNADPTGEWFYSTNCTDAVLPPGGTCEYTVFLQPFFQGPKSAQVQVFDNTVSTFTTFTAQVGPELDSDLDNYPDSHDCAPNDPGINPGVAEVLGDRLDNDCDGIVDNDYDWDGFYDDDCAPLNGFIHPAAAEVEDGIDNDCDGAVDAADDDYQYAELSAPSEVTFDHAGGATVVSQTITITNIGNRRSTGLDVQLIFGDGYWIVSDGCQFTTLGPAESCQVQVNHTTEGGTQGLLRISYGSHILDITLRATFGP